jgi:adenylate cyclase
VGAAGQIAHLDEARRRQGFAPWPFGFALRFGEILWGDVGAAERLDIHRHRLRRQPGQPPGRGYAGRWKGRPRLGRLGPETASPLIPLGTHAPRGIAAPCAVFTVQEN